MFISIFLWTLKDFKKQRVFADEKESIVAKL